MEHGGLVVSLGADTSSWPGFSGLRYGRHSEFRQHTAQICASREPQLHERVETCVERDTGEVEMQGAESVERYRSYAATCIEISRNIQDPAGKLVILEMAQSWLKLAEQAAEWAETVVVYEAAVPNAPQGD
jgi:hypothetical protein